MTMLAVLDAVRSLAAEGACSGVVQFAIDDAGAEPTTYEAATLYAWASRDLRSIASIDRHAAEIRHDFSISIALVVASNGEEAALLKDEETAATLRACADGICALVEDRRSGSTWAHLEAQIDADYFVTFEGRAIMVRISGWTLDCAALDAVIEDAEHVPYLPGIAGVSRDPAEAEPLAPVIGTLYEWIENERREPEGVYTQRRRLTVRALLLSDDAGEQAAGTRLRAVTEAIEAQREALIADGFAAVAAGLWGTVAIDADADFMRRIGGRGFALRFRGYL